MQQTHSSLIFVEHLNGLDLFSILGTCSTVSIFFKKNKNGVNEFIWKLLVVQCRPCFYLECIKTKIIIAMSGQIISKIIHVSSIIASKNWTSNHTLFQVLSNTTKLKVIRWTLKCILSFLKDIAESSIHKIVVLIIKFVLANCTFILISHRTVEHFQFESTHFVVR